MMMFFSVMWLIVAMTGGVMAGDIAVATTALTQNINVTATTISVKSTNGFASAGIIDINGERIAYSNKTPTTFIGSLAQPVIRGAQDTSAAAHLVGDRVRTTESSMMNQSAQYNVTLISDASGPWAVVTIPLAVLRLIGAYLRPQMQFLGTDLQILTYLWWAMVAGMIITVGLSLATVARRV